MVALDRPVKWCSVTLSEVRERKFRIEAGVYDSESRRARERICSLAWGWKPLGGSSGLVKAWVGPRFKRIWVGSGGIPIFQPSAVTELLPEPDGYLSNKTPTDLESLRVHMEQILLTCSGTVGKAGLVSKTLDGQVFSHDLLRLTCRNPQDTGYVYTFLKSRDGQLLLGSNQYGAVITHIEPDHLAVVPVPNASDDVKCRIHKTVVRSYELRDESNALLLQARSLLVDALQLPPLADFLEIRAANADAPQTFTVRLKELSKRFDGSYHLPIVRAIETHLRAHAGEVASVGDPRVSRKIILPGRFKRVYVDEKHGRPMIGGKQLGELDPANKKYLSNNCHKKELDALSISPGTVLVTRSGTIGKVALAPRHWNGWIPSDHIVRIVPAGPEIGGFLYVWLASEWARPLIRRHTFGAVIDEITDEQLGTVPVPFLADSSMQAEINALALAASEKRSEAYDLEREALGIMENEVLKKRPFP